MRTVDRHVCPLCNSPGELLHRGLTDALFGAPGHWSFRRCDDPQCGALWLDPAPPAEDLHLAYQSYYTHGEPQASLLDGAAHKLHRLLVDLMLTPFGVPQARRQGAAMYLLGMAPGRLLDIGCGDGGFLSDMAQQGWHVTGLDFDAQAAAAASRRGLDVRVGTVDEFAITGPETFDVITASHVIEHVPDINRFLATVRGLLKTQGTLVLKTPNARSFGHSRYGRAWRGLEPPRHLQIFTAPALLKCARDVGFSVERCFTTIGGAQFILGASDRLERIAGARQPGWRDRLRSAIVGPLLAARAAIEWRRDPESGEELCAILNRG